MKKTRTVRINLPFVIIVLFLFALIILKLFYVALSPKVDGINLTSFANNRNTKKEIITASRGTIYDYSGEVLAQDVNSYTVIAYLSSSRTEDMNHPHHVVDKEYTAKMLSPLINMSEERIISLLNYDAYQVELGPGGRGITELVKEQIEALDLPGIGFSKSVKRYYPKSNFLSYTLGYAKTDEASNEIIGEMGIELKYNDTLTGKNGYREYQQDMYGYKIANTPEIYEEATKGNDVYLTIDTNVQLFTEQAMSIIESAGCEWASISVMDAKTGKILGVTSSPNFDPNTKNIKSYYDPFVSYTYEPGSTMKIFSFLAAMENGVYDGKETYKSGTIQIDNARVKDWNDYGWGVITFDEGFMGSSNVAATKLAQKLGREKLFDFYTSLNYGKQTGIELPNEQYGVINFKYNIEIAAASFGQGISVTPVQMQRALTVIANDGVMLKPYIISKIVNSETGETIYEGKKEELGQVASKENVLYIRDLMRGVVDGRARMSTGKSYEVKGFNVIGKTGTAQIASPNGGYLTGATNYVRSFAGMYPENDPQVIIYAVVSKLRDSSALPRAIRGLITDTGTYLGVEKTSDKSVITQVKINNYINKNISSSKEELENLNMKVFVIGDGDKIIKQYPIEGSTVSQNDKVFLLTNKSNYVMPNIKSWSRSDVSTYFDLINVKVKFNNYGYVISSSVKEGEKIDSISVIEVTLEPKYKKVEEEIKKEKET